MIEESRYIATMLYNQSSNLNDSGIVKLESLKAFGNSCNLNNYEIILGEDCRFRLSLGNYPSTLFSENDHSTPFAILQFYSELKKEYIGKGTYIMPTACRQTLMSEIQLPCGPDGLYAGYGKKGDRFTLRVREQNKLMSLYSVDVFIEIFEEF